MLPRCGKSWELGYSENVDFTPLSSLGELKILSIDFSEDIEPCVMDLAPLAKLRNLEKFELWRASVNDFSPLFGLTKLSSVSLYEATAVRYRYAREAHES